MQGTPKRFGQNGNLPRHPDAAADARVGLHDVIGLVYEELQELVSAFRKFAAGDQDVYFGGQPGRAVDVVTVKGLLQPVSVVLLESAADLQSLSDNPRPSPAEQRCGPA